MTEARSTRRPRRSTGASNLPKRLVAWFAGEPVERIPLCALAAPFSALLPERWALYKADHPSATPPAGFAWLDDPADDRHRIPADHLLQARRAVASGRMPGW